jgi:hypothetical protein
MTGVELFRMVKWARLVGYEATHRLCRYSPETERLLRRIGNLSGQYVLNDGRPRWDLLLPELVDDREFLVSYLDFLLRIDALTQLDPAVVESLARQGEKDAPAESPSASDPELN